MSPFGSQEITHALDGGLARGAFHPGDIGFARDMPGWLQGRQFAVRRVDLLDGPPSLHEISDPDDLARLTARPGPSARPGVGSAPLAGSSAPAPSRPFSAGSSVRRGFRADRGRCRRLRRPAQSWRRPRLYRFGSSGLAGRGARTGQSPASGWRLRHELASASANTAVALG